MNVKEAHIETGEPDSVGSGEVANAKAVSAFAESLRSINSVAADPEGVDLLKKIEAHTALIPKLFANARGAVSLSPSIGSEAAARISKKQLQNKPRSGIIDIEKKKTSSAEKPIVARSRQKRDLPPLDTPGSAGGAKVPPAQSFFQETKPTQPQKEPHKTPPQRRIPELTPESAPSTGVPSVESQNSTIPISIATSAISKESQGPSVLETETIETESLEAEKQDGAEPKDESSKTKSEEAQEAEKEKKEKLTLAEKMKKAGALAYTEMFDGHRGGQRGGAENLAGEVAVGGPVWGAVSEIRDMADDMRDRDTLGSKILGKIGDKTGISKLVKKTDEKIREKLGISPKEAEPETTANVPEKDSNRDDKGRFKKPKQSEVKQEVKAVAKAERSMPKTTAKPEDKSEKEYRESEAELAERKSAADAERHEDSTEKFADIERAVRDVERQLSRESKDEDRRHRQLMKGVADISSEDEGLLDDLPDVGGKGKKPGGGKKSIISKGADLASKAASVAGPTAAVLGAGAAGFGVGTLINKGIGAATGGGEGWLGDAIFKATKKDDAAMERDASMKYIAQYKATSTPKAFLAMGGESGFNIHNIKKLLKSGSIVWVDGRYYAQDEVPAGEFKEPEVAEAGQKQGDSSVVTADGGPMGVVSTQQRGGGGVQSQSGGGSGGGGSGGGGGGKIAARSFTGHEELGALSEKYESGGRGAGVVSTGKGDHGGVSYGTYQMASKGGEKSTAAKFARNSRWADQFEGKQVGGADFSAKWKDLAQNDPEFATAQHDYIKQTHYDPLVGKVQQDTGVDLSQRSKALQDVLWSTGVQHGGSTNVVSKALSGKDANAMSDEDIIEAIYAERGRVDETGNLARFGSNSKDVQAGVAKRFRQEKADSLAMLEAERKAGPTTPQTAEKQAEKTVAEHSSEVAGKTVVAKSETQLSKEAEAVPVKTTVEGKTVSTPTEAAPVVAESLPVAPAVASAPIVAVSGVQPVAEASVQKNIQTQASIPTAPTTPTTPAVASAIPESPILQSMPQQGPVIEAAPQPVVAQPAAMAIPSGPAKEDPQPLSGGAVSPSTQGAGTPSGAGTMPVQSPGLNGSTVNVVGMSELIALMKQQKGGESTGKEGNRMDKRDRGPLVNPEFDDVQATLIARDW